MNILDGGSHRQQSTGLKAGSGVVVAVRPVAAGVSQGDVRAAGLRANRLEVRNPVIGLRATAALAALPASDQSRLRESLMVLRSQAQERAATRYAGRRLRRAAHFKCMGVYAYHVARCLSKGSAKASLQPEVVAGIWPGRHPIGSLPAAGLLASLPTAVLRALAEMAMDIRRDALSNFPKSWAKHKSPMAVYWAEVAANAGWIARSLRQLAREAA